MRGVGWGPEHEDLRGFRKGFDLYSEMNGGLTGSDLLFKFLTLPAES